LAADGTRVALQTLRGKPLHALAGIARPAQFFAMLEARGLTLSRAQAWPDHHPFSADAPPFDSRHTTLCTEKDAVKLFALFPDAGLHLLAVPLQLTPEPGFFKAFDALLSQLPSPHGHKTP
jgi:tetraacyldisaccharide 4'-kinase